MDEVKQILGDEKGLNPRSRDLVTDIINRLAEQVQTAESSRDLVVRELVVLRERLQVKGKTSFELSEPNPQVLSTRKELVLYCFRGSQNLVGYNHDICHSREILHSLLSSETKNLMLFFVVIVTFLQH